MNKARIDQPKQFSELMSTINSVINSALNEAFTANGVESTMQVFDVSTLQDLSKYFKLKFHKTFHNLKNKILLKPKIKTYQIPHQEHHPTGISQQRTETCF